MWRLVKGIILAIITWEAKIILKRYKPKIVAVVGSVGKTTTKDAITTVLSRFHATRGNIKSYNSEFGVPLTILGETSAWSHVPRWLGIIFRGLGLMIYTKSYPKWLVLELGVGKPGDARYFADWVVPDITVVTSLGGKTPVHVEYFSDREAYVTEELKLVSLTKPTGTLIVNADEEELLSRVRALGRSVISYGFSQTAVVRVKRYQLQYEERNYTDHVGGMRFLVVIDGSEYSVAIDQVVGPAHTYAYAAALSVIHSLRLGPTQAIESLKHHRMQPGRMRLLPGIKNTTLIDDSYNASPLATIAALDTLADCRVTGKKICVLGDNAELGSGSEVAHREIGERAGEVCDILITVGTCADDIADEARQKGLPEDHIYQFEESQRAGAFVQQRLGAGDVVLIKGSQSTRMERVTKEIMEEPHRASELLVRQEVEWLKR